MNPEDKIRIEANRILGEFVGTLKAVCAWEIPDELRLKLEIKIEELENTEIK